RWRGASLCRFLHICIQPGEGVGGDLALLDRQGDGICFLPQSVGCQAQRTVLVDLVEIDLLVDSSELSAVELEMREFGTYPSRGALQIGMIGKSSTARRKDAQQHIAATRIR